MVVIRPTVVVIALRYCSTVTFCNCPWPVAVGKEQATSHPDSEIANVIATDWFSLLDHVHRFMELLVQSLAPYQLVNITKSDRLL
jgi:hypothetical protein